MTGDGIDPAAALREGQRVLEAEADALNILARAMPADFADVVARIIACRGRVIVAGVGKSGHIGRKISATLSSTGTASLFLHAGEASHGDLGMVTRDDICLLISNSGETAELRSLVAYTRRFDIPLIALCARPESTLAKAADYRLILPDIPEACAIGMAPTTSTTLALALGDALAVSVMTQRGFRADDFQLLHPGGKLGAQLSRVADFMHGGSDLPLVAADADMGETLLAMTAKGFGIAGVMQGARLAGVITDGDLRRNMDSLMTHRAIEIATRDPVTVTPDCFAVQALALMNARKISALMVVDKAGAPVGVLHIHDCLRAGVA